MKKFVKFLSKHENAITVVNGFLIVMAFAFLTSCNQIDDLSDNSNDVFEKSSLTLNVSPSQWGDNATTRASYSAFTESSGNKTFSISFTSGDAIGLFAIDRTGKVVVANSKYIYSGSSWTTEDPIEYITGLANYTFFAYYPWVSSLSGAPTLNSTPDITSADTFFGAAVTAWTPAADQGDITKFTSQDLMIAKGTNSTPYFHEVQVNFTMVHQMGLIVTKGTLSYYDIDDPSDTWTVEQTFSPNIPYAISDKYYYFAKPGVATTLGSKTVTVEPRQVEQLYFTNGEPSNR